MQNTEAVLIQSADIIFLVRHNNGLLIGEKIGDNRVENIQKINDGQAWNSGVVFNKIRVKRGKGKPCRTHDQPDGVVGPFIQPHQRPDFFAVILGERFVHAENNRGSHAQLRQREQGKNVAEQTADAQIGFAEGPYKNCPAQKTQQNAEQLAADVYNDIFNRVFTAHGSKPFFTKKCID